MNSEWEDQKVRAQQAVARGDLKEAEAIWLAALDETENFDGNDPRLFATIEQLSTLSLKNIKHPLPVVGPSVSELSQLAGHMIELVDVFYGRRRYLQAEILCKRLLTIYEKEMGPNHPDVGVIAQNLSAIYKELGSPDKSDHFSRRALKIKSQAIESGAGIDQQQVACVTQVDTTLTCQVCGRPILGSARPISGQKCLRCTGTIDSAALDSDRLAETEPPPV